jgi:hypothetical protein
MDYDYDRKQLVDGPVGDHMRFYRSVPSAATADDRAPAPAAA